jgi:cytochrome P450
VVTVTPADLGFQPHDPAFIADPYPVFRELRERHPLIYDERTSQWLVTRHADVDRLLRDRRLGRSYLHVASHEEMGRTPPPEWHAPFTELNGNGMLDREPPDHTRLRRLVLKAFTPRTVEALRDRIQALVDGYIDGIQGAGDIDLIADYIEPLPVTVIADLLGIPEADRHRLRPWSRDICLMYELEPPDASAHKAVTASREFSAYLRDLLRERRARPGDDLISELATVVDEGDRLTEDELIGTCVLLLNAGHEASVNGAGNGWWTLFRHPDQLARLRADPGLATTAIDELLRFDTPLALFERWVLDEIEIDGVRLPRGSELALQFASANRDPAAFAAPDELDLGRTPNPHVSFGAGIHYCLGAPLARLELQVAFTTLLRRAPRIRLVETPTWKPTYVLRGLRSLRVRL